MKRILINNKSLNKEDLDYKVVRVKVFFVNSNNELLLAHNNDTYQLIGGHLKKDETMDECLKREIKEETGITLDEKRINPFYVIKYYCKNYHGSGKNRLVEIYYYIVYCDSKYDDSKKQLDANEIIQNYECRYISICDLKNILIENKKTTKENNSALDDMIIIWDEFLKRYKG